MTMGLFSSHVLKQTDPSVEVLIFFLEKNSYKEDNSPKKYSRRKEHFKLDVWIYLPETSECHWERMWTRIVIFKI